MGWFVINANGLHLPRAHTVAILMRGEPMSNSRGRKLKSLNQDRNEEVFFMSLEEAKSFIADKYDFLAERYERKYPKKSKTKSV